MVAVLHNVNNASSTTWQAVDWKSVRRVRFVNATLHADDYRRLLSLSSQDPAGLRVVPGGRWKAPSGAYCTGTPAAWSVGQAYATAEVVLPASMDAQAYLALPGAGNALLFSADRVEFLRS